MSADRNTKSRLVLRPLHATVGKLRGKWDYFSQVLPQIDMTGSELHFSHTMTCLESLIQFVRKSIEGYIKTIIHINPLALL